MAKAKTLGTQLQLGDGAGTEVFTTIAQLSNIGGIELMSETEDTTVHDSTGGFREHIETGIKSYGEIAFEGLWDEANATHDDATGLRSKGEGTGGPHNFKIVWPDAGTTVASFAASLINVKVGDAPIDGVLPISGTLKISGDVTWT